MDILIVTTVTYISTKLSLYDATSATNIVNGCMNSPSKRELSGKVVCHVKRNG